MPFIIGVPLQATPVGKRQTILNFIRNHPPEWKLFEENDDFDEDTFLEHQRIELESLSEVQLNKLLALIDLFDDFEFADGETPTANFGLAYLYILDGKIVVVGAQ
jgi:hypothetical protein